jgi:hypothetical protein
MLMAGKKRKAGLDRDEALADIKAHADSLLDEIGRANDEVVRGLGPLIHQIRQRFEANQKEAATNTFRNLTGPELEKIVDVCGKGNVALKFENVAKVLFCDAFAAIRRKEKLYKKVEEALSAATHMIMAGQYMNERGELQWNGETNSVNATVLELIKADAIRRRNGAALAAAAAVPVVLPPIVNPAGDGDGDVPMDLR